MPKDTGWPADPFLILPFYVPDFVDADLRARFADLVTTIMEAGRVYLTDLHGLYILTVLIDALESAERFLDGPRRDRFSELKRDIVAAWKSQPLCSHWILGIEGGYLYSRGGLLLDARDLRRLRRHARNNGIERQVGAQLDRVKLKDS